MENAIIDLIFGPAGALAIAIFDIFALVTGKVIVRSAYEREVAAIVKACERETARADRFERTSLTLLDTNRKLAETAEKVVTP